MGTYTSPAFGPVSVPDSLAELLDELYDAGDPAVFMWRGQSDADWPVHSGAYRRHLADKQSPPSRISLKHYENYLLGKARHRGFDIIDGRRLCDLELLARLQHHGAATRLVDFTRSALVALYFACAENPLTTGALIRFHTHYLGGHEGEPDESSYDDLEEELQKIEHPATWQPTGVSPRITVQRSQFLFSRIADDPRGSLQIDKASDSFRVIGVSPKIKGICLDFLRSACDIHRTSLFPDLDGFAAAHGAATPVYGNERW